MRCNNCFNLNSDKAKECFYCGDMWSADPPISFIGKIRQTLGLELSSEIITLSLEAPQPFFSEDEIDSLVEVEKAKPLKAADVPNWEFMFFSSKRVRKPTK